MSWLSELLGGGKTDWNEMVRFSGSLRPEGYLTGDDYTAAEATKTRLRRGVTDAAGHRRSMALQRAAQLGLLSSPGIETTLGRIGQDEALGHERAGALGEEELRNTKLGRERFGQQKAMHILGGKLRDASMNRQFGEARRTAFYNSILKLAQGGLNFGTGGGGGASDEGFMDSPIDTGAVMKAAPLLFG